MRIDHVAIYVADLEGMRAFYERFFNAKAGLKYRNPKTEFESYFLTFAKGARLELMTRPENKEASERQFRYGYNHLAISLGCCDAVDQKTSELQAAGYRILDGPRTTGDGYYESVVEDPEGNRIELTV